MKTAANYRSSHSTLPLSLSESPASRATATASGISIDYTYYMFAHGRAPRGRGRWAFYLGRGYEGEPRFYDGTFGEACRCAVRDARAAGVASITVGS